MPDPTDRHARKHDSRRSPALASLRALRLRWAVALVALAVAAIGAASAQAATGGASPFEGGSSYEATTASSPEAEGLAFNMPMRYGGASWYGPGLYGRHTACGQTLRSTTIGVAHKSLPCGTAVKFVYHGHVLITRVIDRGPYVNGRSWDLTAAASKALGFEDVGVGRVRYAVQQNFAKP
jgi:rare lipoprotein A (peptidoglycan hydrolase)